MIIYVRGLGFVFTQREEEIVQKEQIAAVRFVNLDCNNNAACRQA